MACSTRQGPQPAHPLALTGTGVHQYICHLWATLGRGGHKRGLRKPCWHRANMNFHTDREAWEGGRKEKDGEREGGMRLKRKEGGRESVKKCERGMIAGALQDSPTQPASFPEPWRKRRGRQAAPAATLGWLGIASQPKTLLRLPRAGPGCGHATQLFSRGGWCPAGCQQPPGEGTKRPSIACPRPRGHRRGHVTLACGCWAVTCLVLSPVAGCGEAQRGERGGDGGGGDGGGGGERGGMGATGWGDVGKGGTVPPPQVHVQQTATHQVSRPQSTVYCPALSRVRCPSHCYCRTSDRGKRLSSGLEGS